MFQRTANFSVPARNGPLPAAEQQRIKADYRAAPRAEPPVAVRRAGRAMPDAPRRTRDIPPAELHQTLEALWAQGGAMSLLAAAPDVLMDPEANALVAEFVRDKIRATVKDPGSPSCCARARTRWAPSACAWTPSTTRPSTATT